MRTEERTASILPWVAHREIHTADPGWKGREWVDRGESNKKKPHIYVHCHCDRPPLPQCRSPGADVVHLVQMEANKWVLPSDEYRKVIYIWTGVCCACGTGYFVHYYHTILEEDFRYAWR